MTDQSRMGMEQMCASSALASFMTHITILMVTFINPWIATIRILPSPSNTNVGHCFPLPSTYSRGVLQLELVAMTTGSQWYHSWSLLPLAQYCTTLYHCTITLYHYGLAMKALQTTNCSINAIIIVPRYQLSTHQACGGRIQTPK